MKYLDKIAEFIVTACYIGKIKIAPGTFGSLIAFPICYIIMDFSLKHQVVFYISGYNPNEQQFLSVFFIREETFRQTKQINRYTTYPELFNK